jgi:ornithine cyclodeaminase/alanine dehydrogenase-like protein (mu-crystallin family)
MLRWMDVVTVGPREVRAAVPMPAAMQAVREAFLALARGEFEMPVRTMLGGGAFLVMSAHHRPTASAITKTLSLNFGRDPAIAGDVLWSELSRTARLVADASELTRIRTGAAVGVATGLLAPPGARTCVIIGAGSQAADQVRAVHVARPLASVTIVSRNGRRAESLAGVLAPEMPETAFAVGADPERAVAGADIVCCATTATEPLFRLAALSANAHVNAIGAYRPTMRELPDELLADATVVIDERAAILAESGEVIHALRAGAITEGDLTELGAALASGLPARRGRTVFKAVGVAVQDWAIAALLARRLLPPAD